MSSPQNRARVRAAWGFVAPSLIAIAIFFVEPIILTILGSIFLKETIGWRRYTACGVGFFGSLIDSLTSLALGVAL